MTAPVTPRWRIQVKMVRQPTPYTCVHACLSMVTGVPVRDLMERFGNHGLDRETEETVLTEYGIYPEGLPIGMMWEFGGVRFVTVPSLNMPGHTHRIVIVQNEAADEWHVYDPNRGRAGVRHFPIRAFYRKKPEPPVSYTEVTYLRPLRLHRGTEERISLYKNRMVREFAR